VLFVSVWKEEKRNLYAKQAPDSFIMVTVCPELFSFSQDRKKDKREAERDGKEYVFLLKKLVALKKGRASRLRCAYPKL
jgi:hypothetical protein